MPGMRFGNGDVLDERDLAQHVLGVIAFVLATVDDSEREAITDLEQHHHRHREDAVELAGNAGEFAAGVVTFL
jgi:hypothetical protein